jgi:hypothetical protein
VRANRLEAADGLRWIAESFLIFRFSPLRQLLYGLAFLFALIVAMSFPLVGFALVWLLVPALVVGPHEIARAASRRAPPGAELLLAGFRRNFAAQLRLGGVYLAGMLVVLAATIPADEGRFAQAMVGMARLELDELRGPALQNAMLIGALAQTLLLAALWYAPLLVAWQGIATGKAVFFSAAATLINWRAFLAYGGGMLVLFALVLTLALAGAMLFGGAGAAQANSALFAVLWSMLPVWFAGSYLSYRDVFERDAAGGREAPKSPTIPS